MSEKGNGSSHPPCVVDVNAGMGVGEMGVSVRVWARETMFEQGGRRGGGGGWGDASPRCEREKYFWLSVSGNLNGS